MTELVMVLAGELLEAGAGGLEALRIHEFSDDEQAHDGAAIDELYTEFVAAFDLYVTKLSKNFGDPDRMGQEDDETIPLNGVFRFAIWSVGDLQLFCAAAYEHRELPILLMLGTAK